MHSKSVVVMSVQFGAHSWRCTLTMPKHFWYVSIMSLHITDLQCCELMSSCCYSSSMVVDISCDCFSSMLFSLRRKLLKEWLMFRIDFSKLEMISDWD